MRLCELRQKEVINATDCKCLGNVLDLEFEKETGCIKALIIQGPCKWLGLFCRENELVVKWCDVIRIGPDIILVELPKPKPPPPKR